jgi:hypothetical protein
MDLRPVWGSPIKIKKGIDTNEHLGELRGEGVPRGHGEKLLREERYRSLPLNNTARIVPL